MRQIINVSLPQSMASRIKQEVKKGHYLSTSEFFRDLLRAWMDDRLLLDIHQSQEEIAAGKGKTLRSLKDLR